MEKYISFGMREEIIECDIDITYKDFLGKIQESFNFKEDTFSIIDLTEDNFDEMMTVKDNFIIERSEKDLARERLGKITKFKEIRCAQEVEDYFLVYGYIEDENGGTALHLAAYHNNIDYVKIILEKNFDNVHRADKYGNTPLHLAAIRGYTDIAKLILEKSFYNVHQANTTGETPLYWATRDRHIDIVKLLLEKNFDNAHQKGNHNYNPLKLAKMCNFTEIQKLLEADIESRNNYH